MLYSNHNGGVNMALGIITAALLLMRQYFVSYSLFITAALLAVLVIGSVRALREKRYIVAGLAAAAFLFGLIRLLGGGYVFNILFVILTAVWLTALVWSKNKAASVILCLISILALMDAASASFYIRLMQTPLYFDVQNSFEAEPSETVRLENGGTYISDISYGSEYPNGYLDIYLSPEEACPTFIFVHGGGFTWGDKVDGDPNGGEGGGQQWYFAELLSAGYNIVSINYALAPDYTYPTPMVQLAEATDFLKAHAGEYGLDMDTVIYSGGSAGGAMVGQFVLAQIDTDYSERTGIPQAIEPERIKAVVFASALLDAASARTHTTGVLRLDYMFNSCSRVFFGDEFEKTNLISDTSIIQNAGASFPPTYISDGNYGSFTDQAMEFYEKLTSLGVTAELGYYDESIEKLGHGFEIFNTPCGEDNLRKTIEFLNTNVKGTEK